ncbi:putative RNA-directed DNA polymerase [Arabidopsis thaliana]
MERLCHLIEHSIARKDWKPISLSQGGPKLSHICFADDLILFAEASVAQIQVIRRVLERFCVASGQKVSLEKSKIFFSENVSRDLGKLISDESGISSTRELGKYLGMPVLQRRINKDTFGDILEKMTTRLAGWKGRFLSLAGRVTLTKAVLSSIPVHTMSTIALPKSTLDGLDKVSRSFLWGSSVTQRKQQLISWKRVCKPRSEGGLGIRKAQDMNKALLSKLGWRLIQDHHSLWARIMRCKYRVQDVRDGAWTKVRSVCSSTWRSVALGMREVVSPGLSWVIGDGLEILFWMDKWLTNIPLAELLVQELPAGWKGMRARDLWRNGIGWDMEAIAPYISSYNRLQLQSVVLDDITGARDRISWGESQDGRFKVSTAYSFLTRDEAPRQDMKRFFDRVWSVTAPERVRLFLWLVAQQAIMTNQERHRRHLSTTSICQVCKGAEESIIHVLRDCPAMEGIWLRLVPVSKRRLFFEKSILEWLYVNLGEHGEVGGSVWSTVFALAIWWGWKWRCGNVFGEVGRCRDRLRFIKDLANEVSAAHLKLSGNTKEIVRVERQVSWRKPNEGWVKLNMDGASHGNPEEATAGGALRDEEGNWNGGFVLNIGICTAPLAELWGVYYGLYIAWERRVARLELEVDSEIVVGFLTSGISDSHPLSFLVRLCYGFLSRDWLVRVSHVYREANRLADGLANYAFSLPLGFHSFNFPPDIVNPILLEDANGVSRLRFVRL